VNKIIKLILIENDKYGEASDSTRKGQNFFSKKLFYDIQSLFFKLGKPSMLKLYSPTYPTV
jgi:hypothetical protein